MGLARHLLVRNKDQQPRKATSDFKNCLSWVSGVIRALWWSLTYVIVKGFVLTPKNRLDSRESSLLTTGQPLERPVTKYRRLCVTIA